MIYNRIKLEKGAIKMNKETKKNAKRLFNTIKNYLKFEEEWDKARNSIRNYSPKNPKIIFNDREKER